MKCKRGGIIALVVGVLLILLSSYIKYRVNEAEQGFEKSKGLFSPFSKSPAAGTVGGMIEGKVDEKVAQYRMLANGFMIGGIVLVVVGFGCFICCRKK